MHIIVLFNLKPDADPAAYENWAKTADIPGVRSLASVKDFQVLRAAGLFGSDAPSPYQYFEIIEISGMDPFLADVTSETVQKMSAEFQNFADNPQFIVTEAL